MHVSATDIPGVALVDIDPHRDERGIFARLWCAREFAAAGLASNIVQASVSVSLRAGTLRGLHFQRPPSTEGKLVRCTRGQLFDVVLDLRNRSPSFLRYQAFDLTADGYRAVFVPPGVAHGFMTMADDTQVSYLMTDFYQPDLASGVRWDDPAFGIRWPRHPATLSPADAGYPDFDAGTFRVFSNY